MKLGYARVSTEDQNLALQIDALTSAGCERIYSDQGISGSRFTRPGLDKLLRSATAGDTVVVWRLDRLGRSLRRLVELVNELGDRDIHLHSLNEAIDTGSSGGTLIFHMMAALSEFERSLISERTRAGIAAAKARGKPVGRKRALSQTDIEVIRNMSKEQSTSEIATEFSVHPRTIQRALSTSVK